jgi:hypothetical protein
MVKLMVLLGLLVGFDLWLEGLDVKRYCRLLANGLAAKRAILRVNVW